MKFLLLQDVGTHVLIPDSSNAQMSSLLFSDLTSVLIQEMENMLARLLSVKPAKDKTLLLSEMEPAHVISSSVDQVRFVKMANVSEDTQLTHFLANSLVFKDLFVKMENVSVKLQLTNVLPSDVDSVRSAKMDNAFNQLQLTIALLLPVHLDQFAKTEDVFKNQSILALRSDAHQDQLAKMVNVFYKTDAVWSDAEEVKNAKMVNVFQFKDFVETQFAQMDSFAQITDVSHAITSKLTNALLTSNAEMEKPAKTGDVCPTNV